MKSINLCGKKINSENTSEAVGMGDLRLSKSALLTYKQCPEKFKFVKILGHSDPSGPEAAMGQYLHGIFNEFQTKTDFEKIKHVQEVYDMVMKYDNGALTKHLRHFAAFNVKMFESLPDKSHMKPVAAEEHLTHPVYPLSGYVDAVFNDGESVMVLDYKTGKYDAKYVTDYRFELSIYNELLRKCKGINPTHWGILFTKSGNFWREEIKADYFQENVVPLLTSVKAKVRQNDLPPHTSPLCLYCNFKPICSAFNKQ